MPVNSTHPDYDASLPVWLRARDVLAGEDRVKSAGEKYLPALEAQSTEEYEAYKARASFYNATARSAEAYVGLIFRRPPFVKLPETSNALGKALAEFARDVDLLGNPLASYAKNIVTEVVAVGRAGTLIDWEGAGENRAYVSRYVAEDILNWRTERKAGQSVLTLLVLSERGGAPETAGDDLFQPAMVEQLRVLKLVPVPDRGSADGSDAPQLMCVVELWQKLEMKGKAPEWRVVDVRVPLRLGKPLPLIPFVFHGTKHSQPGIEKLPLADAIVVNLDHYRLDADYKHGMHFTALPTAWVSGFDKESPLRIGSSTAWVTETTGATAGFLEYTGQGLTTFERAMDRDERMLAVLGSRLLEGQKKAVETAQTIELRQSGESSILSNLAASVGASMTDVLKWVLWWNSTEALPEDVTRDQVLLDLNTDFSTKGLSAAELTAIVAAWQSGALSRDSMLDLFRRGEILPDGRTNEEEERLVGRD